MSKQNNKKSILKLLSSKGVILVIQLITSVVFVGLAYILKIIPVKYFTGLIVILILLWLMSAIWMRTGLSKKRKNNSGISLAISKLVSVVISIALLIGSSYIIRGNSFIDGISNASEQTHTIAVYVLEGSKLSSITDIKNKNIGVSYKENSTFLSKGILELEKDLGSDAKLIESKGYEELGDALLNGEIECIIADAAYLTILEAKDEDFLAKIKVIKSYAIKEEIKVVVKDTDVTKNPFIMYLGGIDSYGDVSVVARTDVNLVVVVNPKERQILMVSLPRDIEVTLASKNAMDKLNHAATYGIEETLATLEGFLDLDINYYAKTNFTGIMNIIDSLGEIEIDSPHEDFYTMHGDYLITKGKNTMDGDKALCFVRERKSFLGGDFVRGQNQQLLLKAMLEKAMSSKIITNYSSILSAIEGSFETNMPSDSIRSLINMQLDDMSGWEMFNLQLTGSFERTDKTYSMKGTPVETVVPDKKMLNEIIKVIDKMEASERISEADIKGIN